MQTSQKLRGIRRIGICSPSYIPFKSRRKPHPIIRLAGQWLQDSGFYIGHLIEVTSQQGRLTITIAQAQKYDKVQAQLQQPNIEIM